MRAATLNTISTANSQRIEPPPPPKLRLCRQSEEADVPVVEALQTHLTSLVFGDVDVRKCIERYVCKTLVNVDDEVVAFLVVKDRPNIPAIAHCNWTGWIRRFYRIDYASPWNTLFVHYLVWDPRYPSFFESFLKSLYKNNPKLQQVFLITPPKVQMFTELEAMFNTVYPRYEGVQGSILCPLQNIHTNCRHQVVSKLTVRKAGEEDNIDVQPLVHDQLEVLNYIFGDVKLGNVIDLKNPNKSILVSEKNAVTVGVLSASNKVNYNHIDFFFNHILEYTHKQDSTVDRGIRMGAVRSDCRRAMPFTPETMSTDDQLSLELNSEPKVQLEEGESIDDYSDRDELVVCWDEDGDMFRVVDPVMMEYLLHSKERSAQRTRTEEESDVPASIRGESESSQQTVDGCTSMCTYWGRPSWSSSVVPLQRCESKEVRHQRVGPTSDKGKPLTTTSYYPVENAYMITLFAIHPDLDPRYAFDMLEASFECFEDKHFCLLSLPSAYQGSPLTKHMVRMSPKMSWDFPHELFFVHRNSIFSEFTVRPVSVVDQAGILELVENISHGKKMIKDITSILLNESPETKGFVMECEGNIIGVAVITIHFGLNQLHPHYKIDELVNLRFYDHECHGLIKHLILCPIFLKSGAFFLRQIMNQAGLDTLSYCLLQDDVIHMHHIDVSLITVLGDMIPVKPRRRIQYNLDALDDFKPQDHVVHFDHDFALFIATEKYLNIRKLELNYRIVVVGGSDTAMSFLENLIFRAERKHIKYNNVVLVSIHGFPLELRPHLAGDKMIPHSGIYTREYMSRISLSTHVNVLYGTLTTINRKEKMICVNEDHWLRYDYLFLTTGLQFCKPWPALDSPTVRYGSMGLARSSNTESDSCLRDDRDFPQQDCRRNENVRELYSRASEHYAENLFVINTSADTVIALGNLKKYFKNKKEGKILVYGHGLNTYTCIESLLVFGVPAHKIALVIKPGPNHGHSCLENNPFVTTTIVQTMEEAGVTIYRGFSLICWTLKHKYLDQVMFRNNDNVPITLDCVALFCYGNKTTSAKTYMAVSDAGIVYNNGIIIDNQFRTNDEYIYAAGPGTRYSNRYRPAQYVHHKYYNSVEIGLMLSRTFRRLLEPNTDNCKVTKASILLSGDTTRSPVSVPPDTLSTDVLPDLYDPVTSVAHLPGGWLYVKVSVPGRPVPLECQFNGQGDCGPILITGVPIVPEGPGYFQLSFSVYNTVREIVLLSKREIPYQNLRQLYGKHERLLNRLYEHYNQGLISDFFAFFSQPWAYALYTTRFDELARQCAEIFLNSETLGLPHLHMKSSEFDSALRRLRSGDQEVVGSRYLSSSVPIYVEHLVLKFISERPLQLPMYFTDSLLTRLNQTLGTSPLHRDPAKLQRRVTKTSFPHHDS